MGENSERKPSMFNGDVFQTNHGELTIIQYINSKDIKVRFTKTGYETITSAGSIRKGSVKDYLRPTIANVGCLGFPNLTKDTTSRKIYSVWEDMIRRCYLDDYGRASNRYFGRKVTVCDEWKNFSNFLKWSLPIYKRGYHLDKDILGKGKYVYSPETCYYVPYYINLMLLARNSKRGEYPVGVTQCKDNKLFRVIWTKRNQQLYKGGFKTPMEAFFYYKEVKEKHIKEVAQESYEKGEIPLIIYEKLMQWEVEPYPE